MTEQNVQNCYDMHVFPHLFNPVKPSGEYVPRGICYLDFIHCYFVFFKTTMVCGMALPLSSDETYTVGSKID
jgi:hypothetical protein